MIGGFVIFAGGALLRWHHKRQLESLQASSAMVESGPAVQISWKDDCMTYACRVVGARGHECADMCERAVDGGSPHTRPERMANACKLQCVADETPTMDCRRACFVTEAQRQH